MVGGHIHVNPAGEDVLRASPGHDGIDGFGRSGNDGLPRGGKHRHRHLRKLGDQCLSGGRVELEQGYRSGLGAASHQLRALGDHPEPLGRGQRPGYDRRGDFAHRMPDHRVGLHPVRAPQLRQRQLDTDQYRLDLVDAGQFLATGKHVVQRKPDLCYERRI